jgi:hypothetical protein
VAIKKRILRKPGKGSAAVPSPALISMLAAPCSIETTVRLAARLGNEPLEGLDDDKEQDVAKGVAILRKLWSIYAERATERCLAENPGRRPALWWEGQKRLPVKPRDWTVEGDGERYERERAEADLKFLRDYGHLTREEIRLPAEKRKVEPR